MVKQFLNFKGRWESVRIKVPRRKYPPLGVKTIPVVSFNARKKLTAQFLVEYPNHKKKTFTKRTKKQILWCWFQM